MITIELKLGEFIHLKDAKPVVVGSSVYARLNDIDSKTINDHFFLVNNGGTVRIVRWGKSTFDPAVRVPEFWTEENFHRAFRNRFVNYVSNGERKRKPLSQWWI